MTELRLREEDFQELYRILEAPVNDIDCGAVCSKANNGVPICCEVNVVIPVLYQPEFDYVSARSDLWKQFTPNPKTDQHLMDDTGYDDVMAVCKGHKNCDRKFRSFVCRTFPFYPYIDEEGRFLGLTYNYNFEGKCVIVGKHDMISELYIRQSLDAWNYIFQRDEGEFEMHYQICREIEQKRRDEGKPLHLIGLQGVREL